jgi:hypothetical protein
MFESNMLPPSSTLIMKAVHSSQMLVSTNKTTQRNNPESKSEHDTDYNAPNCHSDWDVVKHGVTQVSVLGPLLFNLYINDFPSIVNELPNTIHFTHDTSILVSSSDNELNLILNSILTCISNWFQKIS